MFSKLKTIKKWTPEVIDLLGLYNIVKNNPQKELIDKIRSVEYKSKEYNTLKLGISCITPHGTFSDLRNENLISLSNYLFFDIDGFDTQKELNDTIFRLLDTWGVSFLQRSVSNKGFHFLIKIDDTNFELNDTNFITTYSYIKDLLIKDGFNIDLSSTGLVRKMIISSDDNVYVNFNSSFKINNDFKIHLNELRIKDIKKFKILREERVVGTIANDTFKDYIISLDDLYKEISIETIYTKEIDGDFVIEEMDYYRIILPQIIKDGTKHKLYTRIINALYFINETKISRKQIFSYLYHVNNMTNKKMELNYLYRFMNNICDGIEKNGVKIKPRVKRLHFNKESDLSKKQKQNMGQQLGAKLRNNNTLRLIEEARIKCSEMNILPTQKVIQEMTGLGIATIKRNWNKEYNDLKDIQIPEKQKINELPTLSIEDFFKQ